MCTADRSQYEVRPSSTSTVFMQREFSSLGMGWVAMGTCCCRFIFISCCSSFCCLLFYRYRENVQSWNIKNNVGDWKHTLYPVRFWQLTSISRSYCEQEH